MSVDNFFNAIKSINLGRCKLGSIISRINNSEDKIKEVFCIYGESMCLEYITNFLCIILSLDAMENVIVSHQIIVNNYLLLKYHKSSRKSAMLIKKYSENNIEEVVEWYRNNNTKKNMEICTMCLVLNGYVNGIEEFLHSTKSCAQLIKSRVERPEIETLSRMIRKIMDRGIISMENLTNVCLSETVVEVDSTGNKFLFSPRIANSQKIKKKFKSKRKMIFK